MNHSTHSIAGSIIPWATTLTIALVCVSQFGCDQGSAVQASKFAPGAFPPVLSDTEYHQRSWTRKDCATCHESGVNQAPKMIHSSVPPLAAEAKCRTCHTLIPGHRPDS